MQGVNETLCFPDPAVPRHVRLAMLSVLVAETYFAQIDARLPDRWALPECGQLCWSPDRGPMRS